MNKFNLDLSSCTYTTSPPNKYHEDDIIDDFMEYVRHVELDSDAIYNIPGILKRYDRKKKYTFKEKLEILFK
jgi:hypothetical protein